MFAELGSSLSVAIAMARARAGEGEVLESIVIRPEVAESG